MCFSASVLAVKTATDKIAESDEVNLYKAKRDKAIMQLPLLHLQANEEMADWEAEMEEEQTDKMIARCKGILHSMMPGAELWETQNSGHASTWQNFKIWIARYVFGWTATDLYRLVRATTAQLIRISRELLRASAQSSKVIMGTSTGWSARLSGGSAFLEVAQQRISLSTHVMDDATTSGNDNSQHNPNNDISQPNLLETNIAEKKNGPKLRNILHRVSVLNH